jgi:NAD(P)-dependent dehydrogenase (short-subunit alcohol dehydrogenase family)
MVVSPRYPIPRRITQTFLDQGGAARSFGVRWSPTSTDREERPMELQGQVALVTGAGSGIGEAIALALAGAGADVVVNDVSAEAAGAAATRIRALGRRSLPLVADVSDGAAVQSMVDAAVTELGHLDILVNNAGIGQRLMAEDITEKDWRRVIDVNLTGVFLCSRAVIGVMKPRRRGNIVNVSSIAGKRISIHGAAHYTASKAGVIGLTRHLAYELGPYGIRVNAICPGVTATSLVERIGDPAALEATQRLIPLGRAATPQDHADAVLMLVSDRARYVTGVALEVEGGILLSWMDNASYERARRPDPAAPRLR